MICCERTLFVLADDRDAFSRSDDLEESAIVYELRILLTDAFKHGLVTSSLPGRWQEIEAERGMKVVVWHEENLPALVSEVSRT
jgi:hypothetical protein